METPYDITPLCCPAAWAPCTSTLSQTDRVLDDPKQTWTFITSVDLDLATKGCQLNPFVLFEGPNINNLTSLDIGCPDPVDAIAAERYQAKNLCIMSCIGGDV